MFSKIIKKNMELDIDRGNIEVYKYYKIDKYLYDLIINHEIWFSDPKNFNDPFDSNLKLKELVSLNDLNLLADDIDISEIREKFDEISTDSEKTNEILKKMVTLDSTAAQGFGVACFSYKNDEILMWSHYSNNHKGICMKFDSRYDEDFFRLSLDVEYTKEYPKIDSIKDNLWTRLSKILRYKHFNWEYENELRVIKINGSGSKKIQLGAITEIIFGCKCSEQDKKNVIKLVSRLRYNHIKFFEAKIKDREFALEITPLKIEYENELEFEISDENFKWACKEMEILIKKDNDELINNVFTESIGSLYEELLGDVVNYVGFMDNNDEREEFLDNHLPKNKKTILEIIDHIEKNNKNKIELKMQINHNNK